MNHASLEKQFIGHFSPLNITHVILILHTCHIPHLRPRVRKEDKKLNIYALYINFLDLIVRKEEFKYAESMLLVSTKQQNMLI
jgi:hypothetical protein